MSGAYETFELDWEGISLLIHWSPECFHHCGHLTIESVDRQRLPMTQTGFRSHFIKDWQIEAKGGAVAYVKAWLDHEAQSKAWQRYVEESRQLCLF